MARIADALPEGGLLAIDTSAFIYALDAYPRYLPVVSELFLDLARGRCSGVTSVVTIMEVTVRPLQLGLTQVADDYEAYLFGYPNLWVRDVDRTTARLAGALRARHRLQPADSLHVASALAAGAVAFLTNDHAIRRVDELPILIIDDFREP